MNVKRVIVSIEWDNGQKTEIDTAENGGVVNDLGMEWSAPVGEREGQRARYLALRFDWQEPKP